MPENPATPGTHMTFSQSNIFPKVMEQKRMRVQSTCRTNTKISSLALSPGVGAGAGAGYSGILMTGASGGGGWGDMRPNFMYPKKDPLG